MKKRLIILLAAVLALAVWAVAAQAMDETNTISYVDREWNGSKIVSSTKSVEATRLITSGTGRSLSGWWYVEGSVDIDGAITVQQELNLILRDGAILNVNGIRADKGTVLRIYGQSENTGTLNSTSGSGKAGIGGIWNIGGLTIDDRDDLEGGTFITGNTALESGGGIFTDMARGTAVLEKCSILDNTARENGGGLYISQGNTVNMENCELYGNRAGESGGGVYLAGGASVSASSLVLVRDNTCGTEGGGVYVSASAELNVSGTIQVRAT